MAKQRTLDRPQKGDMVYMALVYVLAVVAFVATLYPFLYVIAVSFSDSKAVYGGEVYLFPKDVTLAGYEQVLNQPDLWLKYGNTILYTAAGTLFNIVATTLAAYPLSRTRFCARRFLNFFITFTMYFSGGMIPKIDSCVEAVRRGVRRTHIIDGRIPHSILIEMLTDEGIGTMFL